MPIDMLPITFPKSRYEYRELTAAEIKTVEPIFHTAGAVLPDPANSMFVGVVEGGEVVAFLVLQTKLHAEPMWIKEGKSEVFSQLANTAEKIILAKAGPQWVYLFAPAGKVAQLAQHSGMQMEPWVVMSKLVMPEAPARQLVYLMSQVEDYPTDAPVITEEELEQFPGSELPQ